MKKRGLASIVIFSIITLGIYDLFWLKSVKKELNAKTKYHTPSLWLLFAPVLLLIIGLIVAIAVNVSGAHNTTLQTTQDFSNNTSSVSSAGSNIALILVYLVGLVAIVPITIFWFFRFSKAVSEYTHGEMSTPVTFLLLYILRFIGIVFIQDKFNDMIDSGTTPGAAGQGTLNGPIAPQQQTPAYQGPQPPVVPITPQQPMPVNQTTPDPNAFSPNPPAAGPNPQDPSSEQVQQPPQPPVGPTVG